eukprot:TRINITY_DN4722_c0_g1_i1.p1 TRINITY_DN4722_c0_g1~~TRINITY_DN4722_c0_g1_i1.p1  ORF type:complete len:1041 (+),score=247.84 TRINITY_DN4722_c0_g1_i1:192-3125(+)
MSVENLLFTLSVAAFRNITDKAQLRAQFLEMFDKFIRSGSTRQVNIPSNAKMGLEAIYGKIMDDPEEIIEPSVFAAALSSVTSLMESDTLPRFLKDPLGLELMRKLREIRNSGKLLVTVVEAKDLLDVEKDGFSNPYCQLTLDEQQKKTQTKKKNLFPVWKEQFVFDVGPSSEKLDLELLNDGEPRRSLGRVSLPLSHFRDERFHQVPCSLSFTLEGDRGSATRGDLLVELQFSHTKTDDFYIDYKKIAADAEAEHMGLKSEDGVVQRGRTHTFGMLSKVLGRSSGSLPPGSRLSQKSSGSLPIDPVEGASSPPSPALLASPQRRAKGLSIREASPLRVEPKKDEPEPSPDLPDPNSILHSVSVADVRPDGSAALLLRYPAFTLKEYSNSQLAAMCFPEGAQTLAEDFVYLILRNNPPPVLPMSPASTQREQDREKATSVFAAALPSPTGPGLHDDPLSGNAGYLFALAFFKCVPDKSLPRGMNQKAVLVILRQPYFGVIKPIIRVCLTRLMSKGDAKAPKFMHDKLMRSLGHKMQSKMWGVRYTTALPVLMADECEGATLSALISTFKESVMLIWNAIILNQRILFIGKSTEIVAECVLASHGLVHPLSGLKRITTCHVGAADLPQLESTPFFIVGTNNPAFSQKSDIFDVICDIGAGTVTSKKNLKLFAEEKEFLRKVRYGVEKRGEDEHWVRVQFTQHTEAFLIAVDQGALKGRQATLFANVQQTQLYKDYAEKNARILRLAKFFGRNPGSVKLNRSGSLAKLTIPGSGVDFNDLDDMDAKARAISPRGVGGVTHSPALSSSVSPPVSIPAPNSAVPPGLFGSPQSSDGSPATVSRRRRSSLKNPNAVDLEEEEEGGVSAVEIELTDAELHEFENLAQFHAEQEQSMERQRTRTLEDVRASSSQSVSAFFSDDDDSDDPDTPEGGGISSRKSRRKQHSTPDLLNVAVNASHRTRRAAPKEDGEDWHTGVVSDGE